MHGAMVRFVTDGAPGWPPNTAGRRPVMVFGEPSGVQEGLLETELRVWT
jgi:hypothetical protein